MYINFRRILVFVAFTFLMGCNDSSNNADENIIEEYVPLEPAPESESEPEAENAFATKRAQYSIQSNPKLCWALGTYLCSKLEGEPESEVLTEYTPLRAILDFEAKWGTHYTVILDRHVRDFFITDDSNIEFQFIELVSMAEDEVGTRYQYNNISFSGSVLQQVDGEYSFLSYPIECAADVDCEALLEWNDRSAEINLTFEYLGNEKIALVNWY